MEGYPMYARSIFTTKDGEWVLGSWKDNLIVYESLSHTITALGWHLSVVRRWRVDRDSTPSVSRSVLTGNGDPNPLRPVPIDIPTWNGYPNPLRSVPRDVLTWNGNPMIVWSHGINILDTDGNVEEVVGPKSFPHDMEGSPRFDMRRWCGDVVTGSKVSQVGSGKEIHHPILVRNHEPRRIS